VREKEGEEGGRLHADHRRDNTFDYSLQKKGGVFGEECTRSRRMQGKKKEKAEENLFRKREKVLQLRSGKKTPTAKGKENNQ